MIEAVGRELRQRDASNHDGLLRVVVSDEAEQIVRQRVGPPAWSAYQNSQALDTARRASRVANGGKPLRRRDRAEAFRRIEASYEASGMTQYLTQSDKDEYVASICEAESAPQH